MEARHLAREVVVSLAEATQVHVAKEVHQLGKGKNYHKSPVDVISEARIEEFIALGLSI